MNATERKSAAVAKIYAIRKAHIRADRERGFDGALSAAAIELSGLCCTAEYAATAEIAEAAAAAAERIAA